MLICNQSITALPCNQKILDREVPQFYKEVASYHQDVQAK